MIPWGSRQWWIFGLSVLTGLVLVGPLLTVLAVAVWLAVKLYRTRGMEVHSGPQVKIIWRPEFGVEDFRRQLRAAGITEYRVSAVGRNLQLYVPAYTGQRIMTLLPGDTITLARS